MQFGKALLGGIIGAAVGIGLLLAVNLTLGIDKVWLAIPFAIITGLGVRMLVSTHGHASYLRGAMTMVLALAAYIGGWRLVAAVATARAKSNSSRPPAAAAENPADAAVDARDTAAKDTEPEPKQDTAPAAQPKAVTPLMNMPKPRVAASNAFGSPWDVIWLAIAALIAYELGRGSGMAIAPGSQPAEPLPAGTHPDA